MNALLPSAGCGSFMVISIGQRWPFANAAFPAGDPSRELRRHPEPDAAGWHAAGTCTLLKQFAPLRSTIDDQEPNLAAACSAVYFVKWLGPLTQAGDRRMSASLRALLAGVIDYAGLFPPAKLPLDRAVRHYARYRTEPEGWMLGRFVCPASRLMELAPYHDELFRDGPPVLLAALGR